MSRIELTGCSSEPLLHYLKALGVLRLVAEQVDAAARGCWQRGTFVLETRLDPGEVVRFFLQAYEPTPLIACWNGGSGFFPNDRKTGIEAITNSTAPRLRAYREVIAQARTVLQGLGIHSKPDPDRKPSILLALRASLPDEAVAWLDAAYVLTEEDPRYPPLLGTGAIDGRLEFTNNFMQRLCDVLPELGADPSTSRKWLEAALFGAMDAPLVEASVGQYHPGGVGGPNATQGIEADSLVNPWDYVLGLEGTLLLAGGVARRYSSDVSPGNPRPAFPFTVQASAVGYATASPSEYDERASRAEIWLPEWPRPASYREVAQLLSEGRATWGGRQARTGADFARAVISLGVDRGISGFRRFGFLQRSGRAYLAAPLGYFAVQRRDEASLLGDLDAAGWLERFRRAATRAQAPATARRALQAVEGAILRYAAAPPDSAQRKRALQEVLVSLWQAEMAIARSRQFRNEAGLSPFPGVSRAWLPELDDDTDEFRIAVALASIGSGYRRQQGGLRVGPFRMHWEPVKFEERYRVVWDDGSTSVVAEAATLGRRLLNVLYRRVIDSVALRLRHPDIDGYRRCGIDTLAAYLSGEVDEHRLASLIGAFTLIRWDADPAPPRTRVGERQRRRRSGSHLIPWAFAVIKMLFWPWPIVANGEPRAATRDENSRPEDVPRSEDEAVRIRAEPAVLVRLRADDVTGAVQLALQRLRAAGLTPPQPRMGEVRVPGGVASRIAGALLIPTEDVAPLWERAGLPERSSKTETQEVHAP